MHEAGRRYEPNEADVAAFLRLRHWFAEHEVHLLDAIVLTDDYRWWSMHELVTGSTRWQFPPTRV
jgi:hypothetical protein